MGYEVNMFLGERRRFDGEEDRKDWFQVIATIDLCKPYDKIAHMAQHEQGDPVYMYGSDGNTRIVEDCYGKELVAIPADRILATMKREAKKQSKDYEGKGYRRYNMAIPLLEAFVSSTFKNPCVVLYGH